MDTVIIIADLCNPPSERLAFHWLTTEARYRSHLSILVEAEDYAKDIYYHFLQDNGLMAGVNAIVTPEECVDAIRLDKRLNYPNTILARAIKMQNSQNLLCQINGLTAVHANIMDAAQKLIYRPQL